MILCHFAAGRKRPAPPSDDRTPDWYPIDALHPAARAHARRATDGGEWVRRDDLDRIEADLLPPSRWGEVGRG